MEKNMDKDTKAKGIRKYLPLYTATGVCQVSMFIYLGLMPFIYTEFGIETVTFGYVMSAASFLTLCSSPLLGRLADSIGSRTVLILCMLSASAAHIVMGIAWSIPVLIASRFCGVLMDCLPVAQMAVTDMSPESDRSYYLGKLMVPMSIALILGPVTSGFLSSHIGSQSTALLASTLPIAAIILILVFIPRTKKAGGGIKTDKKSGVNWNKLKNLIFSGSIPYLLTMNFLTAMPAMLFLSNFQIAGVKFFKLDAKGLGVLGAAAGVVNLLNGMFILSFITSRLKPDQIMKLGTLLNIITFTFLTYATTAWHLFFALCLVIISYVMLDNHITSTLTKSVDAQDSSTMLGISTAIIHLCRTLAPTVGGALMHSYGFHIIGGVGVAVSVIAVSFAFVKAEKKAKSS